MELSTRAFALTCGVFFGGTVAVVGALNMLFPGYGVTVLGLFAALFPGYEASGALMDWVAGIALAFVDGVVGGSVFAWCYNRFADFG